MSLSCDISSDVKARPAATRKDAAAMDFSMYLGCLIA